MLPPPPPPPPPMGDVRSLRLKEEKHGGEEQTRTNPCKLPGILRDVESIEKSNFSALWIQDEFKNTQECELFSPSPHTPTGAATGSSVGNKERGCFEFVLGCKHHETSTAIRYKNIKRTLLAAYEWWSN